MGNRETHGRTRYQTINKRQSYKCSPNRYFHLFPILLPLLIISTADPIFQFLLGPHRWIAAPWPWPERQQSRWQTVFSAEAYFVLPVPWWYFDFTFANACSVKRQNRRYWSQIRNDWIPICLGASNHLFDSFKNFIQIAESSWNSCWMRLLWWEKAL